MARKNTKLQPTDRAHFAMMEDGTGVILDLTTRRYIHLNASASQAWAHMLEKGGATVEELSAVLAERFEISEKQAKADVAPWVSEMRKRGMVSSR